MLRLALVDSRKDNREPSSVIDAQVVRRRVHNHALNPHLSHAGHATPEHARQEAQHTIAGPSSWDKSRIA